MNRSLPWLVIALSVSYTESTLAYCGATTCGALPDDECTTDAQGCPTDGAPLAWPLGSSVSVVCTNCDELIAGALSKAVQSWQEVSCEGALANVTLLATDGLTDQEENSIFVEMIEEGWPYGASAVGRTTLEFGLMTGTIVHATIGVNAESFLIGTSADDDAVDVEAVLTHELGHALGLAHSPESGATMEAEAIAGYVSELSTLEQDDTEGLCALYPPEPSGPGAEGTAGCSIARSRAQMKAGATVGAGWLVAGLVLLVRLSCSPRIRRR